MLITIPLLSMISVRSARSRDFLQEVELPVWCGSSTVVIFFFNKADITDLMAMSQVCCFRNSFVKTGRHLTFISKHGRFDAFYGDWTKQERLGLFCRSLYSDDKPQTIAHKNRLQLQFCSKSVQTLFLPFCLIGPHY